MSILLKVRIYFSLSEDKKKKMIMKKIYNFNTGFFQKLKSLVLLKSKKVTSFNIVGIPTRTILNTNKS